MILLHSSDLHGSYKRLLRALAKPDYDVWVDTGDFLPNTGNRPVVFADEALYQERVLRRGGGAVLKKISKALAGRSFVCVSGNHDFVDVSKELRKHGVKATNVQGGAARIAGLTFWGFGQIPYIYGEWSGEIRDFSGLLGLYQQVNPDVLLTHAPPQGMFDTSKGYGIPRLLNLTLCSANPPKAHLFGHCHSDGGKVFNAMNTKFSNAATTIQRIKVCPKVS